MATTQITSKQYFSTLKIIHFAMTMGQILFASVTLLLVYGNNSSVIQKPLSEVMIFVYLVLAVIVFGILGSIIAYNYQIGKVGEATSLTDKTVRYQTAFIMRMAFIEAPSLMSIVLFLISGNVLFIGLAGLLILYFMSIGLFS